MATGDINFYLNKYIDNDNYLLFFDFSSQVGSVHRNLVSGRQTLASGINHSTNQEFYDTYSKVVFNSGFSSEDFTIIVDSYKETGEDKTIFSTYENSNSIRSGFSFGTNDINQPYFRYYNNAGPQLLTFHRTVPARSIMALSKAGNSLTMSWFNPNVLKFEEQNFNLFGIYQIKNNTSWLVGKEALNGSAELPHTGNYYGQIYDLIYSNAALNKQTLDLSVQGFYRSGAGYIDQVEIITSYPITGYEQTSGVISIESPYTYLVGTVIDNCGNEFPVYQNGSITGYSTGTYISPLTGINQLFITGQLEVSGQILENQLQNYQYDSVAILRPNFLEDSVYGIYSTTGRGDYFNKSAVYDSVLGTFRSESSIIYDPFQPSSTLRTEQVFVNGVYLFRGATGASNSYILSGDFFNQKFIPLFDYFRTGALTFHEFTNEVRQYNLLDFNSLFNNSDTVIYDDKEMFITHSGFETGFAEYSTFYFGPERQTTIGYKNGVFILNNEGFTGNSYEGLIEGSSYNDFFVILSALDFYAVESGRFDITGFYPKTSRVYLNGQRQTLGIDYIEYDFEVASLLSGVSSFSEIDEILDDGEILFLE